MKGVSVAPAAVAVVPSTAWTNSGTNAMLPNMANPASSPWTLAAANSRSRNNGSGSTGSAARRSTAHSPAARTAASAISMAPPRVRSANRPSSSATTLEERRPAPR